MISAWKHVLLLSKLEPGQTVTILTDTDSHPQTLATAKIAAAQLGAIVNRLELTPINGEKSLSRDPLAYLGATPLKNNPAAVEMLKHSDLVLDLMTLLFSKEQGEILESGTKILLAVEPPEILTRLLPQQGDRDIVNDAAAILAAGKVMHVTSTAGTNATFQMGDYPVLKEYGFVDEPGRWDHWPSGFCVAFSNEGSANGTIVVAPGDILLPQKSYTTTPITMTIKNGFVTNIEGEIDAEMLIDYMESFNDPEAYAISHIGWGTQSRAKWSALSLYDKERTIAMDARAFAGNFLFSTGSNSEAGGQRACPCHIDISMRNCTVKVDGNTIVASGKVIRHVP